MFSALEQHQHARLSERGINHVLEQPGVVQFCRRIVEQGIETGPTVMGAVLFNGKVVAAILRLCDGAQATFVRIGNSHEHEFARIGLGRLVIARALEALHARGFRQVDLSIGAHDYKRRFKAVPEPLAEYVLALTWRGLLVTVAEERGKVKIKQNRHQGDWVNL